MNNLRITRVFTFEMAHVLWNYTGKCKNIHGHSYKLFVTLTGTPKRDDNHPENGMIIDFAKFKEIITTSVIEKFDHALVVNEKTPYSKLDTIKELTFNKLIKLPFQPTLENLLIHFAELIQNALPPNVKLYSLKLHETENSYGEWINPQMLKNF